MKSTPFIDRILEDEGLTSDLDDFDAQPLVAALLERAQGMKTSAEVERLVARGRQVAKAVAAHRAFGAAADPTKTAPPKAEDAAQLIRRLLDDHAD